MTVTKNECSDKLNSDNLAVILYSVVMYSDASSDVLYSVVIVYSVVKHSDRAYSSSDRGCSLYSVVIRES